MNQKWISACMSLTLCAPVGVLALYAPRPWPSLEIPGSIPAGRDFIRIELPPVRIDDADLSADLDTAAIFPEALDSTEPKAAGAATAGETTSRTLSLQQFGTPRPSPANKSDGLLDVSFDLSRPDLLDRSSLDVRKAVRFNGADAGQATIRVGAGSLLFIASEDLRRLLSAAERVDLADRLAAASHRPFVGFDEIRRTGLNLRYDAASDRVLISG